MQRYSVYIMKQLGWSTLIVALSLTSIVWLTQALRFVDFIVNRGVSVLTFLHLTLLLVPSLLLIVLPFALFVSVLFVYNRLLGESELVVMSSSGLSHWQLARPAFQVAACVSLLCYVISLYLLPVTYREFKEMQTFLRDNYASLLLQEGVFNSPVEGLTVFLRERHANGTLRGILVHDNRDPEKAVTMMAQEGKLVKSPEGPHYFILKQGNRQEMNKGRLSVLNFDSYPVDISFYTARQDRRKRKPEEMFVGELFSAEETDPARQTQLQAEAHHRLSWPLYSISLGLFAVMMLLTGEFNRRGKWQRITAASLSALAIVALAIGLQNMATKQMALFPSIYALVLMVGAFSAWRLVAEPRMAPLKREA